MDKCSTFASERLRYRGIGREDAEQIVAWRSRPENYRAFFNQRAITVREHIEWFERYLENPSRFDFMILDDGGKPIGTVGLSNIDDDSCEISYMIGDEDALGRGYAKEAVKSFTRIAFEELGVVNVYARILAGNEASMKVVKGSGFDEYERVYVARMHG